MKQASKFKGIRRLVSLNSIVGETFNVDGVFCARSFWFFDKKIQKHVTIDNPNFRMIFHKFT
jgi:hypothetical protein